MDIVIPSIGDGLQEAILSQWFQPDRSHVNKNRAIYELETDKATLVYQSPASGFIVFYASPGETVFVGQVIGKIVSGRDDEPDDDIKHFSHGL